jgi:NAD(P)-dependent dehydrogenase (short-subunit alcohol dehydrogenase family)
MTDRIVLAGQTALVTGAGRRLGRAVALALARAGANVAIHYRASAAEAEATAAEANLLGARTWLFEADLSDPAAAAELVERAVAETGGLDILVNNASMFGECTFADSTAGSVLENVNVNALAPMYAARAFGAQQRPGAIVNMIDALAADYDRKHVPYHLAKRMLLTLTSIMAIEFAPLVRVNAVAPGLVLPPEGRDTEYLESLKHTNPLNRYGSEGGVADAVLYLLRAGFVTGQTLYVDGGRHLRGNVYG